MPKNNMFPPEGLLTAPVPMDLQDAMEQGTVLEGIPQRCDTSHALHFDLGGIHGYLPREAATAPWISGADREIALISRVGQPTCFTVKSIFADEKGAPQALLSRREPQEAAMAFFLRHLVPGDVLRCRVTHLEPFGAFLDIGRGIIALLPLKAISVSRIPHPAARFRVGQTILAAVQSIDKDRRRITMTHRELLGTWMENASRFRVGETVQGIVRSIQEYGSFIELTPNLSGLTDTTEGLHSGDGVSVYIKSIRPERMKIKLQIIQTLPPVLDPAPLAYQITDGTLKRWVYSPPGYEKEPVETVFKEAGS